MPLLLLIACLILSGNIFAADSIIQDWQRLLKNPDDNELWQKIRLEARDPKLREEILPQIKDVTTKENTLLWHLRFCDIIWDAKGSQEVYSYLTKVYKDPEPDIYEKLGKYLFLGGATKEAIDLWLSARFALKKKDLFALELGRAYYYMKDFKKSATEYARSLITQPFSQMEIEKIVLDLSQDKETRKGVRPIFEEALKEADQNKKYYLAQLLLKIYIMDKDYRQAMKVAETCNISFSYLAEQMRLANANDEALSVISRSLKGNDNNNEMNELIMLRLDILSSMRRYKELIKASNDAIEWYRRYLPGQISLAIVYNFLAEGLYYSRQFDKIPKPNPFQGSIPTLHPAYQARQNLASYYLRVKLGKQDFSNLDEILSQVPVNYRLFYTAETAVLIKDFKGAIELYTAIVNNYPASDLANKALLRLHLLKSKSKEANQILQTALVHSYSLEYKALLGIARDIIDKDTLKSQSSGPLLLILDNELYPSPYSTEWTNLIVERRNKLTNKDWSPQILWEMVSHSMKDNEPQAKMLAKEIIERFPESPAACQARDLLSRLKIDTQS
jgi:TolA-binding protein